MPGERSPRDRNDESDFHVSQLRRHFADNLRQLRGVLAAAQPFQRPTRPLLEVSQVLVCHKILPSPPASAAFSLAAAATICSISSRGVAGGPATTSGAENNVGCSSAPCALAARSRHSDPVSWPAPSPHASARAPTTMSNASLG